MKIAWVTPLSTRSAIARVSVEITERLAQQFDLHLWTDTPRVERRTTQVPVHAYEDWRGRAPLLRRYDHVVYNFGDHYDFHGRMLPLLRAVPGVAVLHDRSLHNLFSGAHQAAGGLDRYLAALEAEYGPAFREETSRRLAAGEPIHSDFDFLARAPMLGEVLRSARGVVTHSTSHADSIRAQYAGPVCALFLPLTAVERPWCHAGLGADGTLRLTTLGWVNPNKHVATVIAALAEDAGLRERVRYTVAGPVPDPSHRAHLESLVRRHGLTGSVQLLGEIPDGAWQGILDGTDVFVTLRYPALEGGSASFVEALATGKPVVVFDTGVYAEAPDGAVVKVAPGNTAELVLALRELAGDAALRERIGRAGRTYAERHTAEAYARAIAAFLVAIDGARSALGPAEDIATFSRQLGIGAHHGAFTRGRVNEISRALSPILSAATTAES